MFSLAVLFFCQSLIQFLKDAVPLSTGNMHHIVGINHPPVQWLMQCLHRRGYICYLARYGYESVLQGLLYRARTAGFDTLGRWDMSCSELQEMLLNTKSEEKQGFHQKNICKKVACISAAPSFMCC